MSAACNGRDKSRPYGVCLEAGADLWVPDGTPRTASPTQFWKILREIATSGCRPPRNDNEALPFHFHGQFFPLLHEGFQLCFGLGLFGQQAG